MPSGFNFLLKVHLQPMAFLPSGSVLRFYSSFSTSNLNSESAASFQNLQSFLHSASERERERVVGSASVTIRFVYFLHSPFLSTGLVTLVLVLSGVSVSWFTSSAGLFPATLPSSKSVSRFKLRNGHSSTPLHSSPSNFHSSKTTSQLRKTLFFSGS